MTDQPRDWDKELAKIDQMMARMPAAGASAAPERAPKGEGKAAAAPTALPAGGRLGVMTTWLRVALGMVLAIAITQWPYPSACGLNLAVYLGVILTVVAAGVWSSISSWQRRLGWAHTLSLAVMGWGLLLLAREVLPRVGYAKAVASWTCG